MSSNKPKNFRNLLQNISNQHISKTETTSASNDNEKIKKILESLSPQYIPCPPASYPNTCIKIPIAFDKNGVLIDALHFIPASTREKLIYVDYHSHEDKNGSAEGYSQLKRSTSFLYDPEQRKFIGEKSSQDWTEMIPVGNEASRI